eukprot:scaffold14958_cov79-Phaeocystis_antarctica.AAC.8
MDGAHERVGRLGPRLEIYARAPQHFSRRRPAADRSAAPDPGRHRSGQRAQAARRPERWVALRPTTRQRHVQQLGVRQTRQNDGAPPFFQPSPPGAPAAQRPYHRCPLPVRRRGPNMAKRSQARNKQLRHSRPGVTTYVCEDV